jgi:hypothetical protein
MPRNIYVVLLILVMIAVVVGVDLLFFRRYPLERLIVNIGIVLVFAAFYLRFLSNPWAKRRRVSWLPDTRIESDHTDFAYVGTRTTGTQAGDYLITGPGWKGQVPRGMTQISSPNDSVLVIGRVLVCSDSDLPTAYNLAKQIQLTPLSQR